MEKYIKSLTLLGIVSQLYTTRMNKRLGEQELNYSQFSLLMHLLRNKGIKEGVSDLTNALELNQPAVTKIVQKLSKVGLLEVQKDEVDSRKKWVTITPAGEQQVQQAMMGLGPDVVKWFDGWSADEMDRFTGDLGRLVAYLDNNRLD